MKVAIVILNFNGGHDTLECLLSLSQLTKSGFEIDQIVVDNASTDNSVNLIRKQFPNVILLVNNQNLGFSEGNNVGIRYALKHEADFVMLLNNDTQLDTNCLAELVRAAGDQPKAGVFGPKIYFSPGHETHKSNYKKADRGQVIWYAGGKIDWDNVLASHRGVDEVDVGQYNELVRTSFVSGCAMFVRKQVFEKVGLFDTKFFLYYEDVDFCQRARKRGFELYYVPKSIVWHKNAESAGGTGSELQAYYITRNRLLIGMRYSPWKAKLALWREALKMLVSGTRTQKQAVGDFLRKQYGPRREFKWALPNINLLKFWPKKAKLKK